MSGKEELDKLSYNMSKKVVDNVSKNVNPSKTYNRQENKMKKKSKNKKITTNKVGKYASDYSKYGDKKTTSEASKAMDAGVRKGLGMK